VLVDGDEVDVLWPEARLIVELDSWEFHAQLRMLLTKHNSNRSILKRRHGG
jgi:hypothetical protein